MLLPWARECLKPGGILCLSQSVNIGLRLPMKDNEKMLVVIFILKHLLLVHATQYGVVDAAG